MRVKKTYTSKSLTLGTTSILILSIMFLIVTLNDWNLSPPAAHVMGLFLIGTMLLSILGVVFIMISIKNEKGLKFYLASVLNVITILIVMGLIFKWF
jgi:hypothetical protein